MKSQFGWSEKQLYVFISGPRQTRHAANLFILLQVFPFHFKEGNMLYSLLKRFVAYKSVTSRNCTRWHEIRIIISYLPNWWTHRLNVNVKFVWKGICSINKTSIGFSFQSQRLIYKLNKLGMNWFPHRHSCRHSHRFPYKRKPCYADSRLHPIVCNTGTLVERPLFLTLQSRAACRDTP